MSETTILVVGDPHAHPRYDNDRFEHIGRFAMVKGVDHVHCVGDWTDFPCLNRHKSMLEARKGNYADDVEAGNDALLRFDEGLDEHPCTKSVSLGNHCEYPDEWVSREAPELQGTMSWSDVGFREHGWRVGRFRDMLRVRGLLTTHYFPSGVSGRGIGGIHAAHSIVTKNGAHCVSGHSHLFDHKILTYGDGRNLHSFVAGCMVHPKYDEPWCANTRHFWQRGLLILRMGRGPTVSGFEWHTYDNVMREVGAR